MRNCQYIQGAEQETKCKLLIIQNQRGHFQYSEMSIELEDMSSCLRKKGESQTSKDLSE